MAAVWQIMEKAQDVELGPILKNYLSGFGKSLQEKINT